MDTEFFKELEKFSLLVKKRVSTAYSGGRKSLRFGHGISPVGYREYRKGDDFKLVDWKVYGRTEKLYIREHEEERSLVVHILLDGSASMGYEGKFAYASRAWQPALLISPPWKMRSTPYRSSARSSILASPSEGEEISFNRSLCWMRQLLGVGRVACHCGSGGIAPQDDQPGGLDIRPAGRDG